MSEILNSAIRSVQQSEAAWCRFITGNDTGTTGSHQAGFYIPKCARGEIRYVEGDEHALPEGHLAVSFDTSAYDTLVYDADAYTYATILRLLETTPNHTLRLATYSTRTGVLITENAVYN